VEARNQADALVHATERSLRDLGDKVDAAERGRIESALSDLKDVIKADDKAKIELKSKALTEASASLAQKAYEQAQAAGAAATDGGQAGGSQAGSGDDGVVDAEFEEVKDGKGGRTGTG
jgi:molecular chaperone DnaK